MLNPASLRSAILDRLSRLPPERLAEVADFVEFLAERESDRALGASVAAASAPAFADAWDNEADAVYDRA